MRSQTPLLGRKNIGATIARRLDAVGLKTVEDLRTIGPIEAYRRIKAAHPKTTISVCYYLYSLQGALDGVHWNDLPQAKKKKLLAQAGVRERATRAGPVRPTKRKR